MKMASRALGLTLRLRYLLAGIVGVAFAVPSYTKFSDVPSDFYVFAYAGRAIFGFMPGYHAGPLHLYEAVPEVQVGPPTLLLSGLLERIVAHQAVLIWSVLIGVCGLVTIRAAELAAIRLGSSPRTAAKGALIGGAVLMAGWASFYQYFHLEDAFAVALIAGAFACLVGRANWWKPSLLLGTAAACKPWALIALCLLVMLAPRERLRGLGVFATSAAVWWLPFIVAAPGTVHAVASLPAEVFTTSTWVALGWPHPMAPPGFRLLQFSLGLALGIMAILRGRAAAAPLVAFAGRIILDPRSYTYYAAGPLAGALIWDLACRRRLPIFTMFTAGCEVLVPTFAPDRVVGWTHLLYAVVVIGSMFLWQPRRADTSEPEQSMPDRAPVPTGPMSPMFQPSLRVRAKGIPTSD